MWREREYKDEKAVMKNRNSQYRGVYRNQTEDLMYYRYEEQLSAARKAGTNKRTGRNTL